MLKNIDGIKKASKKPNKIPETKTKLAQSLKTAVVLTESASTIEQVRPALRFRQLNLLRFVNPKQAATIAITFILTFALSLATSQILASKSTAQGVVLGISTTAPDSGTESALTVSDQPKQNIPFDNIVLNQPETVFLPNENVYAPDPLLHRKEFLKQYLGAEHSPLADHVDAISEQSQWKLIIAIAQAESSSCKKYPEKSANCWGIGGANNLMQFPDLDSAIAHVNSLLENKYISQGLNSPQKLAPKWVGHKNSDWEQAVQQELDNLKNIQ